MKTMQVTQVTEGSRYDAKTEIHTPNYVYEVDRVVNSLTPGIHTRLQANELAYFCDSDDWNVTIK